LHFYLLFIILVQFQSDRFVDLHEKTLHTKARMGRQIASAFPDPEDQPRSDDGGPKWQWQVQRVASSP
jgi:hypothetical protein